MIPNALAWKELPCWLTFSLCKSVCWLLNVNVFGFIFLYNFFWVFVSFKAATGRCLKYQFEIVVNLQYIPVLIIIFINSVNNGFMLALEAFVCVSLWLFSEALSSHISLHFLIIYQDILHIMSSFDKSLFEFVAAMDKFLCCWAKVLFEKIDCMEWFS